MCLRDLPVGFRFDFRLGYRSVAPRLPLGGASVTALWRLGYRSVAPQLPLCTLRSSLFALCSVGATLRSARSGPCSSAARSDGAVEQGAGQLKGNASQTTK